MKLTDRRKQHRIDFNWKICIIFSLSRVFTVASITIRIIIQRISWNHRLSLIIYREIALEIELFFKNNKFYFNFYLKRD